MADLAVDCSEYMKGQGRQPVGASAPTLLSATPAAEALELVAETVSHILGNTGEIAFAASPDHATVTNYTARIRDANGDIVATQDLGVPTPDGNGVIIADLSETFEGSPALPAGNYTVSILTTNPGGSTDGEESDAFSLPLA